VTFRASLERVVEFRESIKVRLPIHALQSEVRAARERKRFL
jgi:hypothetical protein